MGSGKLEKTLKRKKSNKNPKIHDPIKSKAATFKKKKSKIDNKQPLIDNNKGKKKNNSKNKINETNQNKDDEEEKVETVTVASASASQQLNFFISEFEAANDLRLSTLERDSIRETSFVELSEELGHDVNSLGEHIKATFGPSWKEELCEKSIIKGKVDPGSPAVLIISPSAVRCVELLRGVRTLTEDCHALKLFAKHIKVEEQVALLKNRVNIACGTPSRIKKLIDIEALGLSRLSLILLDLHPNAKCYSLLTLPQVSDEFWDLYKSFLHQQFLRGDVRLCLYGPLPSPTAFRGKKKKVPVE